MTGPLRPVREVAAGYDAAAAAYDARYGDRQALAMSRILDAPLLAATRGAERVLEVGVGTGRLLAQVEAPTRVGVDVSEGMLALARARGLDVLLADAQALPFADGSFDAVISAKAVFRYIDPDRGFAEAARVLRVGGVLAVHQFAARQWSPRRRTSPMEGVREVHRVRDLVADARRHGLVAEEVRLYRTVRASPYLVLVPRWVNRACPVQLWGHVVAVFRRRPTG